MSRSWSRRVAVRRLALVLPLAAIGSLASARSLAGDPEDPLPRPQAVRGERFATSPVCAMCHASSPNAQALRDAAGRSVAPYDLWRSSMMASSTRDPLWRAVVAAETAATPSLKAEIEAKCLRCHAPMLAREREATGTSPARLSDLAAEGDLGSLARDGVSCTVCHRIASAGLGESSSWSGHFTLDDGKRIFGPHEKPFVMPMRRHTGFEATEGRHILRSALCATCHTLFTDSVAADGSATGHRLPEQTPYLEWRNSAFQDEEKVPGAEAASCQTCHLPTVDADGNATRTRIARNPAGRDFPPLEPREPVGRHLLVGANTLVPAILRDQVAAVDSGLALAYEATAAAARQQLERRTATLAIGDVLAKEGRLAFRVSVDVKTGHKFPTGHPSRRAWLRVRVRGARDDVLFASGEHDVAGRLVGPDGAVLATEGVGGPVEPHRARIAKASEVAIFEAVMADAQGAPTWRLLRGARYLKDDRVLPRGWRADHPDAQATAPVGTEGDARFVAGSASVTYEVEATGARRIEADLLYETLGARFAAELFAIEAPEIARFRELFERADRRPVVVASASTTLGAR